MSYKFNYNYPQIARDSGFKLQQFKEGALDWRLMGTFEVERIIREQSFELIDSTLSYLSEAPLSGLLETNILDSSISKYFVLSQFSIQYLLFCRKFLDETVRTLKESLTEAQTERGKLKKNVSESNNEIIQLHKKITQMEAIHEVVYPCHACTKNFLTNDALNIHLSRKHNKLNSHAETPQHQEKSNDRNLINAIKLELEIKHLKERLNIAEKEIREKSSMNSRRSSPREDSEPTIKITKHVGIQSNLIEMKEKDDCSLENKEEKLYSKQLNEIQEKLKKFESWQNFQNGVDPQSLLDINQKLQEISLALQTSKDDSNVDNLKKIASELLLNVEQSIKTKSPSIVDLGRLLTEKLSEISRESTEKLDNVVTKIEATYQEKITELEREINRKSDISNSKGSIRRDSKATVLETLETLDQLNPKKTKSEDPQMFCSHKSVSVKPIKEYNDVESVSSVESARTFVKEAHQTVADSIIHPLEDISISSTESEESFAEENTDEEKSCKISKGQSMKTTKKDPKFIRKEAERIAKKRMTEVGVHPSSKVISNFTSAEISAKLLAHRKEQQTKYPKFQSTRNKFMHFVDKLCHPTSTSAVLTKPISVPNITKGIKNNREPIAAKPENSNNEHFKKRLERILSSPMRQPKGYTIKLDELLVEQNVTDKPVPMPRKRVMFNSQQKISSGSDSETKGFQNKERI